MAWPLSVLLPSDNHCFVSQVFLWAPEYPLPGYITMEARKIFSEIIGLVWNIMCWKGKYNGVKKTTLCKIFVQRTYARNSFVFVVWKRGSNRCLYHLDWKATQKQTKTDERWIIKGGAIETFYLLCLFPWENMLYYELIVYFSTTGMLEFSWNWNFHHSAYFLLIVIPLIFNARAIPLT